MDDWASLLNYILTAPLRVVGKDLHKISSGVCCNLRVILKVVMWSKGSLKLSNDSSWGRQKFGGKGYPKTFVVKGESVLLTVPSMFLSVFSLIEFFSSPISFRMLLRRSLLAPLDGSVFLGSSFMLLFSSSSFLLPSRFSSCYSCNLISWFCLLSSSILVVSV